MLGVSYRWVLRRPPAMELVATPVVAIVFWSEGGGWHPMVAGSRWRHWPSLAQCRSEDWVWEKVAGKGTREGAVCGRGKWSNAWHASQFTYSIPTVYVQYTYSIRYKKLQFAYSMSL